MPKKLIAINDYVIFEKVTPELDGVKSTLLLNPDTVNPGLSYGKVISIGFNVGNINIGDFIYCSKAQEVELNHNFEKLYAVKQEFITAAVREYQGEN